MSGNKIVFIFLFLAVLYSCSNDESYEGKSICEKWVVTGFMSVESFAYQTNDGFYPVLEFKNDGSYSLKLDKNICIGNFDLKENKRISISAPGCTKICCDSEFSKKFVQMLSRIESYQVEKKTLKLEVPGWGWINLALNQ